MILVSGIEYQPIPAVLGSIRTCPLLPLYMYAILVSCDG